MRREPDAPSGQSATTGGRPNFFDVQDEVIQHIVTSLEIELSDQERRTITRIPTGNFEAHDFYLRAEYQNVGMTEPESLSRSIAAYRRAIDLDPNFAEAYAGYARVAATVWRGDFSDIMTSAMAKEEAYVAAGKALDLDPENARAYEVLSIIQAIEGEHQIAVTSANKAVDLQPNDAEAHTNLANVLYIAGDLDRAQAEVAIARRLNPAFPTELRLVSATRDLCPEPLCRCGRRIHRGALGCAAHGAGFGTSCRRLCLS